MDDNIQDFEFLCDATVQVTSAYVGNPAIAIPAAEIADVIRLVYAAFKEAGSPSVPVEPPRAQEPAVPIKKSVTNDFIISLESGRKLKMMKRYLMTTYGMTVDDYRRKWNLPADYPMVAPSYTEQRKNLALKIGLGRKPAARPNRKG